MNLSALTDRSAVLNAIQEFRQLGRDGFLAKYGFKPARSYYVVHDGERFDSKALAAAAVGYQYPEHGPLRAANFTGGEATVQRKLERLGFEFEILDNGPSRNPPWTREETILALDLLVRRRPQLPGEEDKEVIELSELLRRYAEQRRVKGNDNFRNPNGVSMKIANLSRLDDEDERAGLGHGSKTIEPQVWAEFMPDVAKLHAAATAIRAEIMAKAPAKPSTVTEALPAVDLPAAGAVAVSRGPRPSFGEVIHTYEDRETRVYVMRLVGRVVDLMPGRSLHGMAVIKVGRSNEVRRRADELNSGFPPGLDLAWRPLHSQTFGSANLAHDIEQAVLRDLERRGHAIGREFAIVPERLVDTLLADAMAVLGSTDAFRSDRSSQTPPRRRG